MLWLVHLSWSKNSQEAALRDKSTVLSSEHRDEDVGHRVVVSDDLAVMAAMEVSTTTTAMVVMATVTVLPAEDAVVAEAVDVDVDVEVAVVAAVVVAAN